MAQERAWRAEILEREQGAVSAQHECRARSLGEWGQDWAEQKDLLSASEAQGPTCDCSSSYREQRPHANAFMSTISVHLHHSPLREVPLFPLTEEEMET